MASSQRLSPAPSSEVMDHGASTPHSASSFGPRRVAKSSTTSSRVVTTVPPWAKDEPPSPVDDHLPLPSATSPNFGPSVRDGISSVSAIQLSEIGSSHSAAADDDDNRSRWWSFTIPRRKSSPGEPQQGTSNDGSAPQRPEMKERNRKSWIFDRDRMASLVERSRHHTLDKKGVQWQDVEAMNEDDENARDLEEGGSAADRDTADDEERDQFPTNTLRLEFPAPAKTFNTLSHTRTPGWESPWMPHTFKLAPPDSAHLSTSEPNGRPSGSSFDRNGSRPRRSRTPSSELDDSERGGKWRRRRRQWRMFILYHNYVPLIIRILNILFTLGGLIIAVRIRKIELSHGVLGAIGSSVTLVIMFAPLTLVHVITAIYLEYFGRPVGLWRTSAKLLHTLLETVFICLWSASLSLCFDNFFTSPLHCAPPSSTHWWNRLPMVPDPLGSGVEGTTSERLCDLQIVLISLVFVGLILYCMNLVISLFRIMEKVKYHTPSQRRTY